MSGWMLELLSMDGHWMDIWSEKFILSINALVEFLWQLFFFFSSAERLLRTKHKVVVVKSASPQIYPSGAGHDKWLTGLYGHGFIY